MGDAADYLTEQGFEAIAAHNAGRCERGCNYCEDEPMSDEPETTAVAVREPTAMPLMNAALVQQTMEALKTIRQFVARELVEGTDYGTIPGAGDKKVMLLPGAQKVNMLYNCYPEYAVEEKDLGGGHAEFRVGTKLVHRGSGNVIGAGVGSCSTMESKYRYRNAARKCPHCGKEAIIKGKAEYGGGWLCFKKKDGCGAKFAENDPVITSQAGGRVENEDIADLRNTVLKMSKKRSLVDASIGLGCLTELFTQDFGDDEREDRGPAPKEQSRQPDAEGRCDEACDTLLNADNADELAHVWKNVYADRKRFSGVQWDRIVAASDKAKTRLSTATQPKAADKSAGAWTPATLAAALAAKPAPKDGPELRTRCQWVAKEFARMTGDPLDRVQGEMDEVVVSSVLLGEEWSYDRLAANQLDPMWKSVVRWVADAAQSSKV